MAKQKSTVETGGKSAVKTPPSALPLSALRDDIDRAFDRMFEDWPKFGGLMGRGFFDDDTFFAKPGVTAPTVDVSEDKKGYHIEAELPGVDESNVEVTVRDNRLSLRGEKKSEKEKKDKNVHMSERRYGSFERTFQLPDDVDSGKIKAEFSNGVLNLTLPKCAKTKSKEQKITVKSKK